MWIAWLIIIFILIVAEVSTINLVSIWFIASGVVVLILSLFIDSLFIQFSVFVLLGLLLLLTTKPILKRIIKTNSEKTNLDRVIGMTAKVTEPILKNEVGEVKVDGKRWSAISKEKLDVGEEVVVLKIDGVKLIVRKKEEK